MKRVVRGKRNIFLLFIAIVSAVLCIVLPEKAIEYERSKFMEACMDMPDEYYPTTSYYEVTKEFSEKLTQYQKRQLISGVWKSEISPVDEVYYEDTPYSIEEASKNTIYRFHDKGFFPTAVESSYQYWYTWDCTYYQALDMNFRTYASFFWKANFVRFNGEDTITLYTTPDGRTIKAIYTGKNLDIKKQTYSLTKCKELATMIMGWGFETTSIEVGTERDINWVTEYLQNDPLTETLVVEEKEEDPETDVSETQADIQAKEAQNNKGTDEEILVNKVGIKDNTGQSSGATENYYYIYVYQSSDRYMFGLIPVE